MNKALFKKRYTIDRIFRSIERQSLTAQRLQQTPHDPKTNRTHIYIYC